MVYLDSLCVCCQWMIKSTRDLQCKVSLLACDSDLLSSISQYLGNTSEQHLFQYLGNSWYS